MPNEFVIFDTEYTAWEGSMERGWNGENEYKEIVEIGAIKVKDLQEVDSFKVYVKPVKNPTLSNYFVQLTGVTQSDVDKKGLTLTEASQKFLDWTSGQTMYSYGYDGDVMRDNALLIAVDFPFETERFKDVRDVFNRFGIDTTLYQSGTIPKAFDIDPPPHAHEALNDARSIFIALEELRKREDTAPS